MPEWLPRNDPLQQPSFSTVRVPLGHDHVSSLTGKVYSSSDLGLVDTPADYRPEWAKLAEAQAAYEGVRDDYR